MWLLYIYLGCLCILVALFVYIRIQWPFWSIQPVFHTYDIWRYCTRRPFQIQYGNALKTKYTDFNHVITIPFSDISTKRLERLIDIIQCHYIPSDRVLTFLDTSTMTAYLTGHNSPAYVSFYCEAKPEIVYTFEHSERAAVYDVSGGPEMEENGVKNDDVAVAKVQTTINELGCMTARPARLYLWNALATEFAKHTVYYWDHLCIHRDHASKPWLRNLIQTHEYSQRLKSPDIPISLFRKEQRLCDGVVPLVKFNYSTFYLYPVRAPPLPPQTTVTRIDKTTVGNLSDYLYLILHTSTPSFTVCAFPEFGSITGLIQQGLLYVYVLKRADQVYALYFLKNAKTNFEDVENGNVLECVATFSNIPLSPTSNKLFFAGFLHALKDILSLETPVYRLITFADLTHTGRILETWCWKYAPIFENPAAYYLYNMVVPKMPVTKEQCFLLL